MSGQSRSANPDHVEAFAVTLVSVDAPTGGRRQSGAGRRQGVAGVHRFTETRSVATQRVPRLAPRVAMSEETCAAAMTASLRLPMRLRRA